MPCPVCGYRFRFVRDELVRVTYRTFGMTCIRGNCSFVIEDSRVIKRDMVRIDGKFEFVDLPSDQWRVSEFMVCKNCGSVQDIERPLTEEEMLVAAPVEMAA